MRIDWTKPALADLSGIQAYIARDSAFYARQFIERILNALEKLPAFPQMGRRVPEADERDDVRELIFQGYRIIYLHQEQTLSVIAVVHGARNLAAMSKPWTSPSS